MLYNVRKNLQRTIHARSIKEIFNTPPISPTNDNVIFLSQVCHADLAMYLVAIKSIYRQIKAGRVYIINDGSLTENDIHILGHHLKPTIIHIDDVPNAHFPSRGCWERLLTCIDLSKENYVIQVDSDLVAAGPLDEVLEAVKTNTAFTLGTESGTEFISFEDAARFAFTLPGDGLQYAAERHLLDFERKSELKYVRGCAGFAGFRVNGPSREFARFFSDIMAKAMGSKWSEWGTEQVTSNVIISNSGRARVLPINRYINYFPPVDLREVALVHFLGTHRFDGGDYRKLSRAFIRKC